MKKQPSNKIVPEKCPAFPIGSVVVIRDGHLWSRCEGEVVSVSPEGVHRIRVAGKNGEKFHTDAMAQEIRWWP